MVHRHPILRRIRPHRPYRPLSISQFNRIVILRPQPILQHKRRHPMRIQPKRNILPLLDHRQMRITPPRSHHHPSLRRIRPRRQINRQSRLILLRIPQRPRSTPPATTASSSHAAPPAPPPAAHSPKPHPTSVRRERYMRLLPMSSLSATPVCAKIPPRNTTSCTCLLTNFELNPSSGRYTLFCNNLVSLNSSSMPYGVADIPIHSALPHPSCPPLRKP